MKNSIINNKFLRKLLLGFGILSISSFSLAQQQVQKINYNMMIDSLNTVNRFNPYISQKDNTKFEQLIGELYLTKEIITIASKSCTIKSSYLKDVNNFLQAISNDKYYKTLAQKHRKHFVDNEKNVQEKNLKQNEKFSKEECDHIVKELDNYKVSLKYFNLIYVGYALLNTYSKNNFNYEKASLKDVNFYISSSYDDFFLNKDPNNGFYIGYNIEKKLCDNLITKEKSSFKTVCSEQQIKLFLPTIK